MWVKVWELNHATPRPPYTFNYKKKLTVLCLYQVRDLLKMTLYWHNYLSIHKRR